jgi:hypothetical protein
MTLEFVEIGLAAMKAIAGILVSNWLPGSPLLGGNYQEKGRRVRQTKGSVL